MQAVYLGKFVIIRKKYISLACFSHEVKELKSENRKTHFFVNLLYQEPILRNRKEASRKLLCSPFYFEETKIIENSNHRNHTWTYSWNTMNCNNFNYIVNAEHLVPHYDTFKIFRGEESIFHFFLLFTN